jgi:hypothetical protein
MVKRRRMSDEQAANLTGIKTDEEKEKESAATARLEKDKDPINILNECRRSGIEARRPHKSNWDSNWNLYNNQYDFSKKAPWQAKNYVAMVPVMVRGIKYLLKQALVTAGDFFDVDFPAIPKNHPYKDKVNIWGKNILRKFLDDNNFATVIAEAAAMSMLESLICLKVMPKGNEGLLITSESSYKIILDPTGRKRWLIHSIETDLDLVMASAKKNIYDIAEVEKCKEEFIRQQEAYEEASRKQQQVTGTVSPPFRKEVILDEFYGDLIGGDGELIMANCFFTVMNEKYLLRKPTPIKDVLNHGKGPIVYGAPNPKPKSVYHQALVSDINGLAHMVTEVLNLTLDTNLFAMARAFEIDMDQVIDPNDLMDGIYPGKTFKKKTKPGRPEAQMIREIQIGGVPQQDLAIYEGLKRQVQNDIGFYNEFSMGETGGRPGGRATAREVGERSAQTSGAMKAVAEEIEGQVIVPLLEQAWSNIVQYFDDYRQLEGIVPNEVIEVFLTDPRGMEVIFGKASKFKAKGMSGVLNRMEELVKLRQFAEMARMFPNLAWMLKGKDVLAFAINSFGWDRDRFMFSDDEIKKIEEQRRVAAVPPGAGGPM